MPLNRRKLRPLLLLEFAKSDGKRRARRKTHARERDEALLKTLCDEEDWVALPK